MPDLNWIAIAAGTVASFLLGWLWYGPLFSKPWMQEMGFGSETMNAAKPNMARLLGLNIVLTLIAAIVMAHVLSSYGHPAIGIAAMIGGGIGIGFVGTSIATNYLFGQKSLRLFLIDAGYWTVAYTAMAVAETLAGQ